MKKGISKLIVIFLIFVMGTTAIIMIDNICKETTGDGGKLVLDVEKLGLFN